MLQTEASKTEAAEANAGTEVPAEEEVEEQQAAASEIDEVVVDPQVPTD